MVPPMVLIVTLTALAVTSLFFIVTAMLTRSTKRRTAAALAGGLASGALEIWFDAVAVKSGLWHYPGYPSHGPLGFYLAAAIGYASLGLIVWRLTRSRFGWRAVGAFFLFLGIYGPIRDRIAGRVTGLFELSPGALAHFIEALLIWTVPTALVWIVIELADRRREILTRHGAPPPKS